LQVIARDTPSWLVLLLGSVLAYAGPSLVSASASRRTDHAAVAFQRAVHLRAKLESKPEAKRRKADYENVIRTFREVYRLDPAYSKTPEALGAIGDLCAEMGQVLSKDDYFLDAVKEYERLISRYPKSSAARNALFKMGEIYRSDLDNPEAARKAFQRYLEVAPKSDKAHVARRELKQIETQLAERTAKSRRVAEARHTGPVLEVTEIRRWVGANYSRIVIGVEDEVNFDTAHLSNPDRIVVDLQNSRLSPALAGKTFPVEDGYLRQIRLAQFTPSVARVVLDVRGIDDYTVIPLPNPFRLVIDIHGKAASVRARAKTYPPAPSVRATRSGEPSARSSHSTQTARHTLETPPAGNSEAKLETREAPAETEPRNASTSTDREAPEEASPTSSPPPARTRGEAPPPMKPAAPTEAGSRTLTRALGLKIGRIVIDPGHGGHDTGTIGPTGLPEKDVVLDVALRLRRLLERKIGCDVVMTRDDDTFIPLEERTAIANQKGADLFISIHANASRDPSARGVETYYLNFTSNPDALEVAARENATSQESVHQLQDIIKKIALTEKIEESHEFARQVQREVEQRVAMTGGEQRDRGVKKAPFVVLIGANMPSILAEISFLSNPRDERLLKRQEYRQKIAEALYNGILRYVKNLGGVKVAQRSTSPENSPAPPANF
jgi:N-acetylmuramoyl-L-alanine amidase